MYTGTVDAAAKGRSTTALRWAPWASLILAVAGVDLELSTLGLPLIELWSAGAFCVGTALSVAAYGRGPDLATRRLGVLALGLNALGLLALAAAWRLVGA